MYALYETATGKLIGASRLPIDNLKPDIWSIKEVEGPHRAWNDQTLQFDDFPTKPRPLTRFEFLGLLTDGELATILEAAKVAPLVAAILKRLELAEEVILDNPVTIAGINGLRDGGLLTPDRAEQILSGIYV